MKEKISNSKAKLKIFFLGKVENFKQSIKWGMVVVKAGESGAQGTSWPTIQKTLT